MFFIVSTYDMFRPHAWSKHVGADNKRHTQRLNRCGFFGWRIKDNMDWQYNITKRSNPKYSQINISQQHLALWPGIEPRPLRRQVGDSLISDTVIMSRDFRNVLQGLVRGTCVCLQGKQTAVQIRAQTDTKHMYGRVFWVWEDFGFFRCTKGGTSFTSCNLQQNWNTWTSIHKALFCLWSHFTGQLSAHSWWRCNVQRILCQCSPILYACICVKRGISWDRTTSLLAVSKPGLVLLMV